MKRGMQVVQDPTQTALSAAFLVQGPNVWPFDSGKQAAFVSALQSTLPGIKPGGITVTSTGAPFRRRVLLQVGLSLRWPWKRQTDAPSV